MDDKYIKLEEKYGDVYISKSYDGKSWSSLKIDSVEVAEKIIRLLDGWICEDAFGCDDECGADSKGY